MPAQCYKSTASSCRTRSCRGAKRWQPAARPQRGHGNPHSAQSLARWQRSKYPREAHPERWSCRGFCGLSIDDCTDHQMDICKFPHASATFERFDTHPARSGLRNAVCLPASRMAKRSKDVHCLRSAYMHVAIRIGEWEESTGSYISGLPPASDSVGIRRLRRGTELGSVFCSACCRTAATSQRL